MVRLQTSYRPVGGPRDAYAGSTRGPLPHLSPPVILRRTSTGWAVEGDGTEQVDTLIEASCWPTWWPPTLATSAPRPATGPARDQLDETAQLRAAVSQLQHALAVRVTIEQAIGILAERTHRAPRDAFEELRKVARSHGRRVHDIALAVVLSVTDPNVSLPGGLPGRS